MARFILKLQPGATAATVSDAALQVPGVADAVPSRVTDAVIVSADPGSKADLARLSNVEGVFEDIQALPQVATKETTDEFLKNVREKRGEENVPPLEETEPLRGDDDELVPDGGAVTLPIEEAGEAEATDGPVSSATATMDFLEVGNLHDEGVTGEGVIAVALDTGACGKFIENNRMLNGVDLTGDDSPYEPGASGHGMMSLGIMAGGEAVDGIETGVAPGASVFPIKSTLAASEIMQAQDIIVSLANDRGLPVVVNNSWAFQQCEGICDHPVVDAVRNASQVDGVYQVFAAGNQAGLCGTSCDGSNVGISGPNSLPSVLTVGATGRNGDPQTLHDYSSRGSTGDVSCGSRKPDVTAPVFGRVPWGCRNGGRDLGNGVGTSAAAPVAAGMVALALSRSGGTPSQGSVFGTVRGSAQPIGEPGFDGCSGEGNVAADAASTQISSGLSTAKVLTGAAAAAATAGFLAAIWERRSS